MQEYNNAAQEKPSLRELILAVDKSDVAAVKALLERGADAVEADKLTSEGYGSIVGGLTCLGYAALHGRIEIVQLLLDAGADINVRDRRGYTPLMRAVGNYKTEMVRLLVNRGASFTEINKAGKTVWDIATEFESMSDILREALEDRARAVAAAAVLAAAEAKAARESDGHDTASGRQDVLKSHARKLTIRP